MSNEETQLPTPLHDRAWELLAQAKPAVAQPNLERIRMMIDAQKDAEVAVPNRNWLKSSAVAAAVALLVGSGGGYQVAAMNLKSDSSAVVEAAAGAQNQMMNPGAATPALGGVSQSEDKMASTMPYFGGRPIFENIDVLDAKSGSALSYVFSADQVNRTDLIKKLQEVFAIEGEISGEETSGLNVGDVTDYVKASAGIGGAEYDKMASWWFSNPAVAPSICDADGKCTYAEGDAPNLDDALAKAQEIFASLGFDADSADWESSLAEWLVAYDKDGAVVGDGTSKFVTVTANLLIAGMNSQQAWQITFGPELTIANANGMFAKIIEGSEYEIVSAKDAAARSGDIRWLNLGPVEVTENGSGYPMPLMEDGIATTKSSIASAGDKIDAGLSLVKVSAAELTIMNWWFADGTSALLPAYQITGTDEDGNERKWNQLAIADKYIDFN